MEKSLIGQEEESGQLAASSCQLLQDSSQRSKHVGSSQRKWVSVIVRNTMTISNMGRKGLFGLRFMMYHLRNPRQELKAGPGRQEPETTEESLSLACSPWLVKLAFIYNCCCSLTEAILSPCKVSILYLDQIKLKLPRHLPRPLVG